VTRRTVYKMAVIYTLMISVVIHFVDGLTPSAFVIGISVTWFSVGRLSTHPIDPFSWLNEPSDQTDENKPQQWGRE